MRKNSTLPEAASPEAMKEEGYQVFWTHTAQQDLRRIIEYIAVDHEEQAKKVYCTLKQKAQVLRQMPLRGRILPELRFFNIQSYREMICSP
jgi:plasmid stabilization system protein ParE